MSSTSRAYLQRSAQFLFGVVAGLPLAFGSLVLIPSIELINSESYEEISAARYLRHYLFYGAAFFGYLALVVAFFRKSEFSRKLRVALLVGLLLGIGSAGVALSELLKSIFGYLFLNYTDYTLRFDIVFSIWLLGLIAVGISLLRKIQRA